MNVSKRPVALITGGSRGVGAATSTAFAKVGYDVVFTYRNKAARASDVAAALVQHGVRALAVQGDMTSAADRDALRLRLQEWSGRLNALVLNASGGLERDLIAADPHYGMRINRDAQVAFLDMALPLLERGSTVVFVTSHWAHLYGRVEQIPAYAPVAESKHAGEQALRARQDELTDRGIRLIVVTGDIIEGTITPKLLERGAPGLAAQRRETVGQLPTAEDLGRGIAAATLDPSLPSGHTIVVGGALTSLP